MGAHSAGMRASLIFIAALLCSASALTSTAHVALEVGRDVALSALVNGAMRARLCVDTGLGGAPIIGAELAARLNLRPHGTVSVSDPSGLAPLTLTTSQVDSLAIGDVVFHHIEVTIQPDRRAMRDCQGVVGLGLFSGYLVTLDLPQSRLVLEKGQHLQDGSDVLALSS